MIKLDVFSYFLFQVNVCFHCILILLLLLQSKEEKTMTFVHAVAYLVFVK